MNFNLWLKDTIHSMDQSLSHTNSVVTIVSLYVFFFCEENDEMHGIGKAREKVHMVVLKGYMCGLESQSHNNPFKCAIIELQ
jgi:hypothetical protein